MTPDKVEEIVEDYRKKFLAATDKLGEEGIQFYCSRCFDDDSFYNWLRTTLTQELQKAREEALAREKQLKQVHTMELDAISCMSLEQYVDWRDQRKQRPNQSELDQDKK